MAEGAATVDLRRVIIKLQEVVLMLTPKPIKINKIYSDQDRVNHKKL